MYKDKVFRVRSEEEIIEDLEWARSAYGEVRKIFLADGDALILPFDTLVRILEKINNLFPECERVSIYATPQDVLRKTPEELRTLFDLGLGMAYLGAESGSDTVLKNVKKGASRNEIIEAIHKIEDAKIKASVTFISGLGGKTLAEEHAVMTGSLISEATPSYVGLLTLLLDPSAPMYQDLRNGEFGLLNAEEIAIETLILLENINATKEIIFRSNHASNYVPLSGTLPYNKKMMMLELQMALDDGIFKDEVFRRL